MSILADMIKGEKVRLATEEENLDISAYGYIIAQMVLSTPNPVTVLIAALSIVAHHGIEGYSSDEAIDFIANVAHANLEYDRTLGHAGQA